MDPTPPIPVGQPAEPAEPVQPVQPVSSPPSAASTQPGQTSTKSIIALVCGILSLTCCGFISGIPAIFIGRAELQGIDAGQIPASNRTLAKVGLVLGIIGTILSCLGTLAYVILIALGISTGMMQNM
ncbi:MAG: DUF4190 domain-containing protein [Deltaproteobacteria bacterium]|nr:DUF4190 domain-containing protein [Deltaproteobacteria bacterium]